MDVWYVFKHTVLLIGNFALAHNLHTRHSNARYAKLDYSQAAIRDKTLKSLLTQRYLHKYVLLA